MRSGLNNFNNNNIIINKLKMLHNRLIIYENKLITVLSNIAIIFLSLSFYFKYTKGLLWISYILFFYLIIYLILKFNIYKIKAFKLPSFILIVFLILLFWYVIISPSPMSSLDAFLVNYFFHAILFYYFFMLAYFSEQFEKVLYKISQLFLIITFIAITYFLLILLLTCKSNIECLLFSSIRIINSSFLRGVLPIPFPLTLGFFVSLALFFNERSKLRYFYLLSLFLIFLVLIILGRRAALLGIFIGLCFNLIIMRNFYYKKIITYLFIFFITLPVGLFTTSYGKKLFLEGRDNISLLLTLDKNKWPQAGSLGQRLHAWTIYFKKSLEEPFSGTGLARRVQKKILSETNKKASNLGDCHNLYLNLAIQAGWHTALYFIFFYFWTLKKGYKLSQSIKNNYLSVYLFIFLIAYLIISIFTGAEEGTRFTPFWIASGIIWGFGQKYEQRYQEKSSFST